MSADSFGHGQHVDGTPTQLLTSGNASRDTGNGLSGSVRYVSGGVVERTAHELAASDFCLCPAGDTCVTSRLCSSAGCSNLGHAPHAIDLCVPTCYAYTRLKGFLLALPQIQPWLRVACQSSSVTNWLERFQLQCAVQGYAIRARS